MENDTTKTDLSFYEKLFMLGHDVELTNIVEGDEDPEDLAVPGYVTQRVVTKEPTLALAYHLLVQMRGALIQCMNQFMWYGNESDQQLQTAHLSLVERQDLERKRDRDLGISRSLNALISDTPVMPDSEWRPISTAPQDGSYIRLLGRRSDGRPFVETGRWTNICWSVQNLNQLEIVTHWKPLDRLPKDY